jgi:uncharacterized LabA/DUF88 family protein
MPKSMPAFRRMMVFVDGENVVFNYQSLLKEGKIPRDSVIHEPDIYAWEPKSIINPGLHELLRVKYYTYATGNDERITNINNEIKSLSFTKNNDSKLPNNLFPVVFNKPKKSAQRKGVDIQMTVDILSQVYYNNIDTVYLIAGDGDYLPIIDEVIRMGKQIYLAAFSAGLNKKLEHRVDLFNLLDNVYFKN